MDKGFTVVDKDVNAVSNEVVEYTELTGEPTIEELKMDEATLLAGVLGAAADNDAYRWISISRPDPKKPGENIVFFRFRVKALDEKRIKKMAEAYTTKTKNRQGILVASGFREVDFNTEFIYAATHPEDRKAIWDNQSIQRDLGVDSFRGCIDKVLKAGEKERVVEIIAQISGYDDAATVELVKNS